MPRVLFTVLALAAALATVTVTADDELYRYVDPDARHPGFLEPC